MARYSGKKGMSAATREEGMRIALSTQRPGQTKEQTRLIAQGIQRGIDLYKKQQKAKARDLDRRLRRAQRTGPGEAPAPSRTDEQDTGGASRRSRLLPWLLLALTWVGIAVYGLMRSLPALLER